MRFFASFLILILFSLTACDWLPTNPSSPKEQSIPSEDITTRRAVDMDPEKPGVQLDWKQMKIPADIHPDQIKEARMLWDDPMYVVLFVGNYFPYLHPEGKPSYVGFLISYDWGLTWDALSETDGIFQPHDVWTVGDVIHITVATYNTGAGSGEGAEQRWRGNFGDWQLYYCGYFNYFTYHQEAVPDDSPAVDPNDAACKP